MKYSQHQIEHLRLETLRLLENGPGYTLNDALLRDLLAAGGLSVSGDRLHGELHWLEEQGLVELQGEPGMETRSVKLSGRGQDVAKGLTRVPGVARPRPGDV